MGNLVLKNRLKVVTIATAMSTSLQSSIIRINLAKDEVILLRAVKHNLANNAPAGWLTKAFLYRKTENVPTATAWSAHSIGDWREDAAVLDSWFYIGHSGRTAESIAVEPIAYQSYPLPIVLIRPPSLLTYGTVGTTVSLTLWYTIEKASKAELAELMIKDHA